MNNLIQISNIYYNNALDLVKNNEISKAVELIEKCLKYYAKDVQALNLMGLCQYILCDFDKAYFYWSKSLVCDDKNNRAKYYLDVLNSDNFKMVIQKYNSAIDSINNFRYKDAINTLEEISQSNKELIEPYVIIGLCYYELREYNLAKKYIQHALTIDKDNSKYLIYLNEINSKNISDSKNGMFKYKIVASILVFLLTITSTLYYQSHNKYIKISNQTTKYQENMQKYSMALDTIKTDYNKLKNELEDEKQKNNMLNTKIKLENKEINNNKIFSGSESEIFENAIVDFKNQKYDESIDRFQYIISKGVEEILVAESTYYIAACYEKKANIKQQENTIVLI